MVVRYVSLLLLALLLMGIYQYDVALGGEAIVDSPYNVEYSSMDVLDIILGSRDTEQVFREYHVSGDQVFMASIEAVAAVSLNGVVKWFTETLDRVVEDLQARYGFTRDARLDYNMGGLSLVNDEVKLVYLVRVRDGGTTRMYASLVSLDASTGEYLGIDWAAEAEELGLRYRDVDVPINLWYTGEMGSKVMISIDERVYLVDMDSGDYTYIAEGIRDASIGPGGYIALYTGGIPMIYVFKAPDHLGQPILMIDGSDMYRQTGGVAGVYWFGEVMLVIYREFVVQAYHSENGTFTVYTMDLSSEMRRVGLAPIYSVSLSPDGELLSVIKWEEGRKNVKLNIGIVEVEVSANELMFYNRYRQTLTITMDFARKIRIYNSWDSTSRYVALYAEVTSSGSILKLMDSSTGDIVDINPLADQGIKIPFRLGPLGVTTDLYMHPSRPLMILAAWWEEAMILAGYDLASASSTIYAVLPDPYFSGRASSRLGLRNMAIDWERGSIYYAWMAKAEDIDGSPGYVEAAIFRYTPSRDGLYMVEKISTIDIRLGDGEELSKIGDPGIWVSPDGGKVALLIPRYSMTGDLYIFDTDTGEVLVEARGITVGMISDYLVEWSPDTRYAVFLGTLNMSIGEGVLPIYILDTETGDVVDLSYNFTVGFLHVVTDFLTDVKKVGGERLLYVEKGSLAVVIDIEGRSLRFGETFFLVMPGKGIDISPDGSIIARITADTAGSREIRVVAISTDSGEVLWSYGTGVSAAQANNRDALDGLITWSPSGDYLVAVVSSDKREANGTLYLYNIYLFNRDGELLRSSSAWLPPAEKVLLSPDGGNVVFIGNEAGDIVYGVNFRSGEPIVWSSWLDMDGVSNIYFGGVAKWIGLDDGYAPILTFKIYRVVDGKTISQNIIGLAPPLGGRVVYSTAKSEYLIWPVETGLGQAILLADRRGNILTADLLLIQDVQAIGDYVPIVVYAEPGSTVTISTAGTSKTVEVPTSGVVTLYVERGAQVGISTSYGATATLTADSTQTVELTARETPPAETGEEQPPTGGGETGGGEGSEETGEQQPPAEEPGEPVDQEQPQQPEQPEQPSEQPPSKEEQPSGEGGLPITMLAAIAIIIIIIAVALFIKRR